MRTTPFLTAILLILSVLALAGAARGDAGVGACVLGQGFSVTTSAAAGPFAGANVGTASQSGVYVDQGQYEAQCCAETGQAPDCFRPAA